MATRSIQPVQLMEIISAIQPPANPKIRKSTNSLTNFTHVTYYMRMMTKTAPQEITATQAGERLHLSRSYVIRTIKRGELTARLVTEAPRPYWLITIDDKFLAKEKERAQK
jgi:hypothetical protein